MRWPDLYPVAHGAHAHRLALGVIAHRSRRDAHSAARRLVDVRRRSRWRGWWPSTGSFRCTGRSIPSSPARKMRSASPRLRRSTAGWCAPDHRAWRGASCRASTSVDIIDEVTQTQWLNGCTPRWASDLLDVSLVEHHGTVGRRAPPGRGDEMEVM